MLRRSEPTAPQRRQPPVPAPVLRQESLPGSGLSRATLFSTRQSRLRPSADFFFRAVAKPARLVTLGRLRQSAQVRRALEAAILLRVAATISSSLVGMGIVESIPAGERCCAELSVAFRLACSDRDRRGIRLCGRRAAAARRSRDALKVTLRSDDGAFLQPRTSAVPCARHRKVVAVSGKNTISNSGLPRVLCQLSSETGGKDLAPHLDFTGPNRSVAERSFLSLRFVSLSVVLGYRSVGAGDNAGAPQSR